VRHKTMINDLARCKSADPSGLKIDRDYCDHALTGVAIECRPFGPELEATMALWISPHFDSTISARP
jgi:hypothetical protein